MAAPDSLDIGRTLAATLSIATGVGTSAVGRSHHVEVDPTIDTVHPRPPVRLPDEPSVDVGPTEQAAFPEVPRELLLHTEPRLEVLADVEHDAPIGATFDLGDEPLHLGANLDGGRVARSVEVLQVDDGREVIGTGRGRLQEVVGLRCCVGAQREVVVGADLQTGRPSGRPVRSEPAVADVASLGGLDVREADVVAGDAVPVDLALVRRRRLGRQSVVPRYDR